MKKVTWIIAIALFCFCVAQEVLAEEKKEETKKEMVRPWRNFELDVGAALTALSSSVSFSNTNTGLGIQVDVEDALDIDSSSLVWFAGGYYRFGSTRRHRFDFSYTAYHRDATTVVGTNIPIFDDTILAGSTVYTKFDFDIIRAGYSYSLLNDDRMDIGIGAGLYVMPIDFEINTSMFGAKSESITAPLPVVTLRGDFALTKKLFLRAATDVFYLKIDNFEGSILAGRVGIDYDFWKNVGFGLGFNNFTVEVDGESSSDYPNIDFNGNINFQYRGLLLYTKITF